MQQISAHLKWEVFSWAPSCIVTEFLFGPVNLTTFPYFFLFWHKTSIYLRTISLFAWCAHIWFKFVEYFGCTIFCFCFSFFQRTVKLSFASFCHFDFVLIILFTFNSIESNRKINMVNIYLTTNFNRINDTEVIEWQRNLNTQSCICLHNFRKDVMYGKKTAK